MQAHTWIKIPLILFTVYAFISFSVYAEREQWEFQIYMHVFIVQEDFMFEIVFGICKFSIQNI